MVFLSGCSLFGGEETRPQPTEIPYVTPVRPNENLDAVYNGENIAVEIYQTEKEIEYYIEVVLPTPCDSITVNHSLESGTDLQVMITQKTTDHICTQVLSEKTFFGKISLDEQPIKIEVYYQGEKLSKNV